MSIQINDTTVIDDARNIINVGGANVVGVITATAFVDDGTDLLTAINEKASTGKAIAMAMVFGG